MYVVKGLRLEDDYFISPCSDSTSRWMRLNSSNVCSVTTGVDGETYNTIQSGIANSQDTSNMYVREMLLSAAQIVLQTMSQLSL